MQEGHCPRCAATTIRSNTINFFDGMPIVPVFTATVYVCIDCGYVEWYVPPDRRGQLHSMYGWTDVPVTSNTPQAYTGATQRLDVLDTE